MQTKSGSSDQGDLFRSRLDQILNRQHPLYRLADSIDWLIFDRELGSLYVENVGRPGLPIRLLVGLHYLKHAYNVSDETVVDQFIENGYWLYFCIRKLLRAILLWLFKERFRVIVADLTTFIERFSRLYQPA